MNHQKQTSRLEMRLLKTSLKFTTLSFNENYHPLINCVFGQDHFNLLLQRICLLKVHIFAKEL